MKLPAQKEGPDGTPTARTARAHWDSYRETYACEDGCLVAVREHQSLLLYGPKDETQTAVAVSRVQYDRDMGLLIGPESAPATLSFPPSVRWVCSRTFERAKRLRGVVPNEGLEEL